MGNLGSTATELLYSASSSDSSSAIKDSSSTDSISDSGSLMVSIVSIDSGVRSFNLDAGLCLVSLPYIQVV